MSQMTEGQLARELQKAYAEAPEGQKVIMIHLFGIRFAEALAGQSLRRIVEIAGVSKTYVTEINKGKNLAPFVLVKNP